MSLIGDTPKDRAITRLKVGAVEDLTCEEIYALLAYIDEIETMFDNVMSTLNVEYDDMFPPEEEDDA